MAQHASGSRRRIIYKKEDSLGVLANLATGFALMRNTSDSINLSKTSIVSDELTGDRAIRNLRHGNKSVAGDTSFEFAAKDFDVLLAAVMGQNDWTANKLKQGMTIPSFLIEKGFQDISQFIAYKGCVINTMSLEMATDAIVTGSFGIIGTGTDGYTQVSKYTGADNALVGENTEPFVAFEGEFKIDDVIQDACVMTALSLSLDNGITANYTLCGPEAKSITPDRFNVTGTVTALFTDATLINRFINEEEFSLSAKLIDPEGNALVFDMPRVKFTGGEVPVSDGGVVTLSLPFQALYDDSEGSTLVIERIYP